MEYRSTAELNGKVMDMDDRRHEVQVVFPHGPDVVDGHNTTFHPEAFRASLAKRYPIMCWSHRIDEPIGRVVDAQLTSRAIEARARFSDLDAVPMARRAWSQLMDHTVEDFSHGFIRHTDRPHETRKGVREITLATMQEISPCARGSIPGARAISVRSSPVDDEPWTVTDVREELRDGMAVLWRAGKMTQRDVAQKIGVSRLKVEAWERGEVDDFVGLAAAEYTKLWQKWDVA